MRLDYDQSFREGMSALERSDVAAAERHLRDAIDARPDAHHAHYLLGATLAQMGQSREAEQSLLTCLRISPNFAIARFQLGLLQLVNGAQDAGRQTLVPLVSESNAFLARFAQGLIAVVSGRREEAISALREGLLLNEQIPVLNRDMQGVLSRLESTDPSSGTIAAAVAAVPARATDDSSHVLISAYRQP